MAAHDQLLRCQIENDCVRHVQKQSDLSASPCLCCASWTHGKADTVIYSYVQGATYSCMHSQHLLATGPGSAHLQVKHIHHSLVTRRHDCSDNRGAFTASATCQRYCRALVLQQMLSFHLYTNSVASEDLLMFMQLAYVSRGSQAYIIQCCYTTLALCPAEAHLDSLLMRLVTITQSILSM